MEKGLKARNILPVKAAMSRAFSPAFHLMGVHLGSIYLISIHAGKEVAISPCPTFSRGITPARPAVSAGNSSIPM